MHAVRSANLKVSLRLMADCAKHFKMGSLIRQELQALKRLHRELSELKEEAFNKQTGDYQEEFATITLVLELLKMFVSISKQPFDQENFIDTFEGKLRLTEVAFNPHGCRKLNTSVRRCLCSSRTSLQRSGKEPASLL